MSIKKSINKLVSTILSLKREFAVYILFVVPALFFLAVIVAKPTATLSSNSQPVLVHSVDSTGTQDSLSLDVWGNYAFTGNAAGKFYVLDHATTTGSGVHASLNIEAPVKDVIVTRDYAYLATGKDSGELIVVDTRQRDNPTIVGSYNAFGSASGLSLAVSNNRLYLGTANNSGANGKEFLVLDISNPESPGLVGSFEVGAQVKSIAIDNNKAYIVTSNTTAELRMLDISNPLAISLIATYNLPGNGIANAITHKNGFLYVVSNNGGSPQPDFFEFSTDNNFFTLVSSADLASDNNDIVVRAGRAFIATQTVGKQLTILDVSNPMSPVLFSTYNAGGASNKIKMNGPHIYLATGNNTQELQVVNPLVPLRILDINNDGIIRIGCLGDSNTFNWSRARWCDFLVQQIAVQTPVGNNSPAFTGATVTHNPKGGLWDAYGQMPMVLAAGVDVIILPFGTNDINLFHRTPEEIVAAYSENKATAEAAGFPVFIALTPPLQDGILGIPQPEREATNNLIKQTFPSEYIIDFSSTMIPEDYGDLVHMNNYGQFERARKAYERFLYSD
ncbi:MAG: GDSL-type esterase/lipase family protein [Patescibacteria group bacterium]